MGGLKKYFFYFLVGIAVLLLFLSLLSLFYDISTVWWIKALNFPRTQALITAVALFILASLTIKKLSVPNILLLAGILISIIINGSFVIAYTPLAAKQVAWAKEAASNSNYRISILIANVYIKNKNADAFLEEVMTKNPDMVLAMETNRWWQKALQPLRTKYDYFIEYPLEDSYGIMLYSRYPLQHTQLLFLHHPGVPSIHTVVQLPGRQQFFFHGVHPVPPVPSKYPDNIGTGATELQKVAALVAKENGPVIVAGDFNDVAWSNSNRVFRENSRLKDVRAGRGLYNTFNAHSIIMRWPLDHVFVTGNFKLITIERLNRFGSDHFPLYVQLALLP